MRRVGNCYRPRAEMGPQRALALRQCCVTRGLNPLPSHPRRSHQELSIGPGLMLRAKESWAARKRKKVSEKLKEGKGREEEASHRAKQ